MNHSLTVGGRIRLQRIGQLRPHVVQFAAMPLLQLLQFGLVAAGQIL